MSRVVIVGGGVIGLFCAVRLAQAGARVVLLEAEQDDYTLHGPAASLAAAGMLAPLTEWGDEKLQKLSGASFDLWRSRRFGAIWADGVRFDGAACVIPDEKSAAALMAKARALGRSVTPLSPGQWQKRTGLSTRVEHAFYLEDEGVADPARVLSGLAMEARRFGAIIRYGQDVAQITANSARTFEGETFEADHIVLAPGVWASDALMKAAPALKLLRPAKGHLAPVKLEQPLRATIHAPGFYMARRGENDVVLGAEMEFDKFSRQVDPARLAALLAAAETLLPGEVTLREDIPAWAGVRPMSPDGGPMIGRSGAALIAAGHSRNGWLLAPITAEIVCAHVLGETLDPLWSGFTPDRFG